MVHSTRSSFDLHEHTNGATRSKVIGISTCSFLMFPAENKNKILSSINSTENAFNKYKKKKKIIDNTTTILIFDSYQSTGEVSK